MSFSLDLLVEPTLIGPTLRVRIIAIFEIPFTSGFDIFAHGGERITRPNEISCSRKQFSRFHPAANYSYARRDMRASFVLTLIVLKFHP